MQLKNDVPIEMDCRMPELAENAPVQGLVRKNKRRRRMLIFCVVSLVNVGLLALILTQLLTPAPHSGSVSIKYGLTSLPQTIFINRNGTVVSREPRELTAQVLSSNLHLIM